LKKRAADVLACFDRHGTEAINGRLEHLRGSALGFRNLTNYIARSLLETGGFRPVLSPESAPAVGWVEHGNPPRSSLRRCSMWTDTESLIRTRIVR
jgi:hypothetical protein